MKTIRIWILYPDALRRRLYLKRLSVLHFRDLDLFLSFWDTQADQDLNFRLEIETKVCTTMTTNQKWMLYFHISSQNYQQSQQKLDSFLEKKENKKCKQGETLYISVLDFLNLYFTKLIFELDFWTWYLSILNLIFSGYTGSKNQVWNRQEIKLKNQFHEIEI